MKENFEIVLDRYLKDNDKSYKGKDYYIALENLKNEIRLMFDEDCEVKASVGKGNRAVVPWLGVFNKTITDGPKKGIYIVFLFKKNMEGFYITLCQGIEYFEQKKISKKLNVVTNYLKKLIETDLFSKEQIDLELDTTDSYRPKNYEKVTIISKLYKKGEYTDKELKKDIKQMKVIYEDLIDQTGGLKYDEIISNVLSNDLSNDELNLIKAKDVLNEDNNNIIKPIQIIDIPKRRKRKTNNTTMTQKSISKKDYVKVAEKNIKIGYEGEKLVCNYEINKLKQIGREDLVEKIKWVSKEDDSKGYDIVSYNVEGDNEVEIYIEVKTTTNSNESTIYISKNELDNLKNKPNYYIYRVCIKKDVSTMFIMNAEQFEKKYSLETQNYIASLKEEE